MEAFGFRVHGLRFRFLVSKIFKISRPSVSMIGQFVIVDGIQFSAVVCLGFCMYCLSRFMRILHVGFRVFCAE